MKTKEREQVVSRCPSMGLVRSWGNGGARTITLRGWTVWADADAFRTSGGMRGRSGLATSILSVVEEGVIRGLQGEFRASVEGLDQSLCLGV